MIQFHATIFSLFLYTSGQPSSALVPYHVESCGIPLHDAVGENCKKVTATGAGA